MKQVALRIPQGFAWETDMCGCGGTNYPGKFGVMSTDCPKNEGEDNRCTFRDGERSCLYAAQSTESSIRWISA